MILRVRQLFLGWCGEIVLIDYCFVLPCLSPPTNSEEGQPKTQATVTQEELTQDERPCSVENSTAETDNSGQIHSVLPIIKSPSPDVYGHYPPAEPEPLGQKKTGLQRCSVRKTHKGQQGFHYGNNVILCGQKMKIFGLNTEIVSHRNVAVQGFILLHAILLPLDKAFLTYL